MYPPNDHLAHQRSLQATSDEVNAGAPAHNRNAPAQYYNVWQHLPQELSPPPNDLPSPPHYALSPPHEAYSSIDQVHHTECAPEPRNANQISHRFTRQHAEHCLPTPPLRNDSLRKLLPRISNPDSNHGPQEFPSCLHDLLPQTRKYLAAGPNIVNTNGSTIWNTDGTGGNQDEWTACNPSYQTHHSLLPSIQDHPPFLGRQPLLDHAATSPFAHPAVTQYAPLPQSYQARRASSIAWSPTLINHHAQQSQMPAIQQWRTDNLAAPASARANKKKPDASIRRKQEAYRQKAEARRHTIATGMPEVQALVHRPLPTPGPSRAKAIAPTKRRKITPATGAAVCEARQSTPDVSTTTAYRSPYGGTIVAALMSEHPVAQNLEYHIPVVEQPPPTRDDLPQPIVSKYEDYKWSVYHYELQSSKGYDFAERWLEALFANTLQAEHQRRHLSHVSHGFIKDGGRRSLIVLHNAANPFEYEPTPDSTITIGVYGYHWYRHDEIHWTTLGSDQRLLLTQCVQAGFLKEKHKWTFDTEKATEKRFHRAYWLAANRLALKDLLNRGPSADKPHDLIEDRSEADPDKDFGISEAGLTNEWDVTEAEAAAVWQKVQDELEALDDTRNGLDGWQHVVISNSEW